MNSIDRRIRKYLITAAIVMAFLLPLTTFNQIVLAQPDVVINVVESINVTDSPEALPPVSINVVESITVIDIPEVLPPVSINVSESITVADTPAVIPPATINVIESVTVSDSPQVTLTGPPDQPINLLPTNGETGVNLTPALTSSAFSDPDMGDTHDASQWQISKVSGSYVPPDLVFDSGRDTVNLTSIAFGGLEFSTTYYWRVRYQDNQGVWSAFSAETSFTTEAAPDNIPPAAVADLAVSDVSTTTVTLAWTAPGDDGNVGTASQYDIRMSESTITEANFYSAIPLAPPPAPNTAGSSEAVQVTPLTEGTTYYFALKTADEVPNWSGLSHVISATTHNTPAEPSSTVDLGTAVVTFADVSGSGTTSVTTSQSIPGGSIPEGFSVLGSFVEVTTTATYTGPVTVCIGYAPGTQNPGNLKLFHLNGSIWEDVTDNVDTVNQRVCGEVEHLSWFFIGGQWVWVDDGATGVPIFPSLYIGIAAAFGAAIMAYLIRRRLIQHR